MNGVHILNGVHKMNEERKRRRTEKRESEMIDGAKAVFVENGYENTSIKLIAKNLDMSVGAVYNYFDNKDELYYAVIKEGLQIVTDMFSQATAGKGTGFERFASIGMAYVTFWKGYPEYQTLLHGACPPIGPNGGRWGKACYELNTKRMNILVQTLQSGMEDGSIRPDIDAPSTAFCVASSFHGVLSAMEAMDDDTRKPGVDEDSIVKALFDLFTRSLAVSGGGVKK